MTHKTATDLFTEVRARVTQLTVDEAMQQRETHPDTVMLDCREPNEWNLGHIPGALFIPRGILESNVEAAIPREARVIIYCSSGNRSAMAVETLRQMGYADVVTMDGGFRGWIESGGEFED